MAVEIENIFRATAQSPGQFLITNGQGCYIPAYQRRYSWDRDNVQRLLDDALNGLGLLLKRPNVITFLGAVIAIHDTKYLTIKPIFKTEVAPRVMTIIDGQQRLCTLLMINVAFHECLNSYGHVFDGRPEKHFQWITEQCQSLLGELEDTFVLDRRTGGDRHRFYPRIIRAFQDVWSKIESQAQYTSPIARLTWEYVNHFKDLKRTSFRFDPKDGAGKSIPEYRAVVDVFRYIQKSIDECVAKEAIGKGFPDLSGIVHCDHFMEAIWRYVLPDEVKSFITGRSEDKDYEPYCKLVRVIALAKYINNLMAFTVVQTESEDDAFDMFEALNTTGEPLTAFETFKPKVIEAEGLLKYETSPSNKSIDRVEQYLEQYKKAEEKQSATSEMLIPFALAESGEKLQKRLNEQRLYLREKYDVLPDLSAKRDFVGRLANLATFMQGAWNHETGKSPDFSPLEGVSDEAKACFEALRELKHHITIGPLLRFYGRAVEETDESLRKKLTAEFEEALKATASFSMLWRGAFGGTENIDSHYRDIMRQGYSGEKILPLSRQPKTGAGAVSLSDYKRALRHCLQQKGHIGTRDEWVKSASQTPIYLRSAVAARFILFCASDDAVPDPAAPGLLTKGRKGVASMLTLERWQDGSYFTVEHIAPRAKNAGWDVAIYDDLDTPHRIGNLLLLPAEANQIVGNRSWNHKQLIYRLLSSATEAEYKSLQSDCATQGLTFSKRAKEVCDNAIYLGMCRSVSDSSVVWDLEFIRLRSKRIAELAWDRLAPWLDLK